MENIKTTKVDVNEVVLQGKIVHKYVVDKATLLTINTGRATLVPNYPKVVFFGAGKDEAAKYNTGDNVRIVGNIQSSKRNPNIKNQQTISIFGEEITAAETQFEKDFGIPGVYAIPVNHFKLAGTITEVNIPNKNNVTLVVKTMKNGHVSYVKLVHFTKNPEQIIGKYLPGEYVCVSGLVQTSKLERNGEPVYLQSYIANEIRRPTEA